MKYGRLSLLVLGVAVGCRDAPSPPTGVSAEMGRQPTSPAADDYVATPAGWAHRSCVHMIPNGARLDKNRVVTRRDGTRYQLPKCLYPTRPQGGRGPLGGVEVPHAPTNPGWIETAWIDQDASPGARYRTITANWTVPANPTVVYPDPPQTRVYYTFPALENPSPSIIQPVLQYGYNGLFGGRVWTIASWQVSGSDYSYSTPDTVAAGSQLYGSVVATNCAAGSCDWTITTRDVATGDSTTLTFQGNDDYAWATGGAVEVYGFAATGCDQYPRNGVFYSNISLFDHNLTQLSPSWNNFVKSNPSPSCSFSVTSTPTSVNLYHNPPPPPSVYITGPLQISHYQSAQYFANVSGGAPPLHYQWQSRHCSGGTCGAWSGWTAIGGPYDRSDTWASTTTCSVNVIELKVKVTDALLGTAQNQIGINVSPGGGPCG